MKMQVDQLSDRGGRSENEDFCAYLKNDDYGCFLVADGLGGHRGGALASTVTGESILDAFDSNPGATEEHLRAYIDQARERLVEATGDAGVTMTPKTTLVVMLTDNQHAVWAHVGDSRLYKFRKGKLKAKLIFQTRDHSVPQQLANSGEIDPEDIRFHEDRNRLISVFDNSGNSRIEYYTNPDLLEKGDAFLLCSDGFWEYVFEREMEKCLARSRTPKKWIARMEKKLLKRAEAGHDNYSALAVMITG